MASYPGVPVTIVSGALGSVSQGGGSITVNSDGSITIVALASGITVNGNAISQTLSKQYNNGNVLSANSGTQTFSTTFTIPANVITTGVLLKITLAFLLTTSAATVPNETFTVTLGGVTVFATAAIPPAASMTSRSAVLVLYVLGTVAPSASSAVDIEGLTGMLIGAAAAGFVAALGSTVQPVNLATNGPLAIAVQWTTSNSTAGNTAQLRQLIVEQC